MNDNVRPVFILRRQKPDPQYKKFHFIQVKSKACIPLALMNTDASCTDFFILHWNITASFIPELIKMTILKETKGGSSRAGFLW